MEKPSDKELRDKIKEYRKYSVSRQKLYVYTDNKCYLKESQDFTSTADSLEELLELREEKKEDESLKAFAFNRGRELEQRNKKLEEVVDKYGQHKVCCKSWRHMNNDKCDCGWNDMKPNNQRRHHDKDRIN